MRMNLVALAIVLWANLSIGLMGRSVQAQSSATTESQDTQAQDSKTQGNLDSNIANAGPSSDFDKLRRELHFQLMQSLDRLEPYLPVDGLKGKIILSGSTTMNDLNHRWTKNLKSLQPELEISGSAIGSEAAIKELANDPELIIGVSRSVDEADLKFLQSGKCKEPVAIIVGLEALAVVVHAKNPIERVTPDTIKSIFADHKDARPSAGTWGSVGVIGEFASQPIQIYERDENSGTSVFISRTLLSGAALAKPFQICSSNNEVCSRISLDPNGIGFADIHTSFSSIRRLPVLVNGLAVEATEENVLLGRYPLLRPLLLVFDKNEMKGDAKLRESIVRYALSRDGQIAVMASGFFPLDSGLIKHQLSECLGQQLR